MADDALALWGKKGGLGRDEMGKNGVLKRDGGITWRKMLEKRDLLLQV
jgi:hypothetical protein